MIGATLTMMSMELTWHLGLVQLEVSNDEGQFEHALTRKQHGSQAHGRLRIFLD